MSCGTLSDVIAAWACTGSLEIDEIACTTQAWTTTNLTALWLRGPVRGSNIVLPHSPGEIPFPRRLTAFELVLPMVLTGCHDADGDPYEDPFVGLQANAQFLDSALAAQPANTRLAVLTLPDGSTRQGPIHVQRFQLGDPDGGLWRATLEISIPGGRLA